MACAAARAIRRRAAEMARPGGLLLRRRFRWCWSAQRSRRLLAYRHTRPLSARRRAISRKTRKSSAQLVIRDFGSTGDRGYHARGVQRTQKIALVTTKNSLWGMAFWPKFTRNLYGRQVSDSRRRDDWRWPWPDRNKECRQSAEGWHVSDPAGAGVMRR